MRFHKFLPTAFVLSASLLNVARETPLYDSIRATLDRAVADSAFPGAMVIVGTHDRILAKYGAGHLDWAPSPVPTESTMWDMASLTKVIAMTSSMMQLVEKHQVDLDAPVQRYLPTWTGPNKDKVTVRHLLTHSSGLPAWRPLYKEAADADAAMKLAYATPLDTLPGIRMVYSDIGGILMGEIVRAVTGERIDEYFSKHIAVPLKLHDTMFLPPAALLPRIAPTEIDPWRQRHLRGEVHDENAAMLGGVSGHAGLFSSARDLARIAQLYLNHGTLEGVRILEAGDDRAVYDRARFDFFKSRARLGNSDWHKLRGSSYETAGVRAYRVHRDFDLDRSGA